jgi:hypothetical protein
MRDKRRRESMERNGEQSSGTVVIEGKRSLKNQDQNGKMRKLTAEEEVDWEMDQIRKVG